MSKKPTLHQKGRYGLQYRGVECNNCQHPLDISDRFCPNCSQANSNKKLSLKDFFDEFFASLVSYDSRLLKTLSALLTKPGKITRDFLSGKRVSYTNPFRFLLSLSIIYFLLLSLTSNLSDIDRYGEGKKNSLSKITNALAFLWDNISENDTTQVFQIDVEDQEETQKKLDTLNITQGLLRRDSIIISNPKSHFEKTNQKSLWTRFFAKREFFNVIMEKDSIDIFSDISPDYGIISSRENRGAFNAAKSFLRFKKQPGSFLNNIISKLPFATFFFLPVFTLFISLVYIRKKHNYTEHLIFSFHNQSLFFILLIVSLLIEAVFNVSVGWIFIFIFSIYLFLSMLKFYEQGFFKTMIKYVFLNTIFSILALFATLLLFAGSIFTY